MHPPSLLPSPTLTPIALVPSDQAVSAALSLHQAHPHPLCALPLYAPFLSFHLLAPSITSAPPSPCSSKHPQGSVLQRFQTNILSFSVSKKSGVIFVNTLLGYLCWVKILGCLGHCEHTNGLFVQGKGLIRMVIILLGYFDPAVGSLIFPLFHRSAVVVEHS